jgi:hypothetical protein
MDINEMRKKYGSNRFSHLSDEQKHELYEMVKRDAKKYQKLGKLSEALQKSVDKAIKKEETAAKKDQKKKEQKEKHE